MNQELPPLKEFLLANEIPFDGNFIRLPEYTKRINLDIGTSFYAPHSNVWLKRSDELFVFGFEPVKENIDKLKSGTKPGIGFPEAIDHNVLNKKMFIIPCALGEHNKKTTLYVTTNHSDCSSIYEPVDFQYYKSLIPMYRLEEFLKLIKHEFIDYIKIDTQGSDLEVVKGGGDELCNRVIYITLEPNNDQYIGTNNSEETINKYMESIGFIRINLELTNDPTFVNSRLISKTDGCIVFQKT